MGNRQIEGQDTSELFRQLFEEQYQGMMRYASAILKARDSGSLINGRAEVAVQETFMLAWERRDEVLTSNQPASWLYKALYYKILEILKEENRWRKRLLLYERNYVPPVETHISLDVEFEGLVPKEDFDLLWRMYGEGYSYAELCRETGLTKSALAVKIHRIKKKIQKQLDDKNN